MMNTRNRPAPDIKESSRTHTGSALVEALLVFGVLTTFMLGIPMLGSMIDLQQSTIQASRYIAWEKTVAVDPRSVPSQVDKRFFQAAAVPISSGGATATENSLWGKIEQPAASNKRSRSASTEQESSSVPVAGGSLPMFERAAVRIVPGSATGEVGFDDESFGEIAETISKVVTETGRFVSPDGWDNDDLLQKGIVMSTVKVKVAQNELFTFANCGSAGCMDESTSILIDGWSGIDSDVVRERVHGFVPTNRLEPVGRFVSRLKALPMLKDLKYLDDAFGCVKTPIVPGKKLGDELPAYQLHGEDNC